MRVKRSVMDALSGVVKNILSKYYPEKYTDILSLKHKNCKNSVEYGLATMFALLLIAHPDQFARQVHNDRKDEGQIRYHDSPAHSIIIRITISIDITNNQK